MMMSIKYLFVICLTGFVSADLKCSEICASGTCCNGPDGKYLCCPAVDGVCCPSGNSCCPPGTKCEADGSCLKISPGSASLIRKSTPSPQKQALTQPYEAEDNCRSHCNELCCAFENGVCCGDGEHCCPAGYQCDEASKSCRLALFDSPKSGRNCPTPGSGCDSTDTCCVMADGSKGCCPYQNADCCLDGLHCCPQGTVCNSDSTGCVPKSGAWLNPFEWSLKLAGRKEVICPGSKTACNKGSTCCKANAADGYACCPFENAVCCGDGEHCCPQGYTCDLSNGGSCVQESSELPQLSTKAPEKSFGGNKCKDGKTVCSDEATCCALGDGNYACCPIPDAVCCEDHEHCCPNGYTCDVAHSQCIKNTDGSVTVPMVKKVSPSFKDQAMSLFKSGLKWFLA